MLFPRPLVPGGRDRPGACRQSPHLAANLVQKVDKILARWERNNGPGFDPCLCAQDTIKADPAAVKGTETADGTWTITRINCGQ